MEERTKELREASGTVTYTDPVTSFFYELMRDHLPAGEVEKLVRETVSEAGQEVIFTNGWLARYANNLANLLQKAEPVKLRSDLDKIFSDKVPEVPASKPEADKPMQKEIIKEIIDDDLAAVKKLIEDDNYSEVPDEYVEASLGESKAALEALAASGQIGEDEINIIKQEIEDLSGASQDVDIENITEETKGDTNGRKSEAKKQDV